MPTLGSVRRHQVGAVNIPPADFFTSKENLFTSVVTSVLVGRPVVEAWTLARQSLPGCSGFLAPLTRLPMFWGTPVPMVFWGTPVPMALTAN